ncbi:hypothetical protein LIER_36954 [Lithospermum erythrorhizon]|uniref:Uncharacterized protein n=1 Tax=Lithospermum erythrorhizon TaxID=34254 RepID=A0AAV3PHR5_LITER
MIGLPGSKRRQFLHLQKERELSEARATEARESLNFPSGESIQEMELMPLGTRLTGVARIMNVRELPCASSMVNNGGDFGLVLIERERTKKNAKERQLTFHPLSLLRILSRMKLKSDRGRNVLPALPLTRTDMLDEVTHAMIIFDKQSGKPNFFLAMAYTTPFNSIEGFLKVKFDGHGVDDFIEVRPNFIDNQLGKTLIDCIAKAYGSILFDNFSPINLWDETNICGIDFFNSVMVQKSVTDDAKDMIFDGGPTLVEEDWVQTIWPGGFEGLKTFESQEDLPIPEMGGKG